MKARETHTIPVVSRENKTNWSRTMANLTTKELSALDDQIRHEQVLVKKYQAMACLCSDTKVQSDLNCIADKHQRHFNTLMGFLS